MLIAYTICFVYNTHSNLRYTVLRGHVFLAYTINVYSVHKSKCNRQHEGRETDGKKRDKLGENPQGVARAILFLAYARERQRKRGGREGDREGTKIRIMARAENRRESAITGGNRVKYPISGCLY